MYSMRRCASKKEDRLPCTIGNLIPFSIPETTPGNDRITPNEEFARIEPIVSLVREKFPDFPLSIDSFYPEVIEKLSKYSIDIINNVTNSKLNEDMIDVISQS